MLDLNEISNVTFEKTPVFGYKTDDVDYFKNEVVSTFKELNRENGELKKKLAILAAKIEEYRADEHSLQTALVGAQKLGDSVIRESKEKAEAILAEANTKAEKIISETMDNQKHEEMVLLKMKKEVTLFKNKILMLYRNQIELINALPEEKAEKVEAPAEPAPAASEEPKKAPEAANSAPVDASRTNVYNKGDLFSTAASDSKENTKDNGGSKFGPMKFGSGYKMN